MRNIDDQQELKLLLEEAYELIDQMGRQEAEDPEERAARFLERAATWVSEAGCVSLGYLSVEALVEDLKGAMKAKATSADNLDEFNPEWLRYELIQRGIDSDEWKKRTKDALEQLLQGIARRLLKNARRRRRRTEKKTRQA